MDLYENNEALMSHSSLKRADVRKFSTVENFLLMRYKQYSDNYWHETCSKHYSRILNLKHPGNGALTVLKKAGSDLKIVSVIGDSTFFHSGMASLMDIVYNRGNIVTIILDNRITAMQKKRSMPL